MNKKIVLIGLFTITIIGSYLWVISHSKPIFFQGTATNIAIDQSKPGILLSCLSGESLGGGEVHGINIHAMLQNHGYHVVPLVQRNSAFEVYFKKQQIAHYSININKFSGIFRPLFHLVLKRCFYALCTTEKLDIIQINSRAEIPDAVYIKKQLPIKIFYIHHSANILYANQIRGIDALVTVNILLLDHFKSENLKHHLGIGQISFMPPFFNTDKFLNYTPTENRLDFFKNNFGIIIRPCPSIAVIANFHKDLLTKNHSLLFDAMKMLMQKNKPVQVMLAGDGVRRQYLESLVKKLEIEEYVHFLGFTDKTPGILYHSEMMALPSSNEAFGIVHLEAGLMKKPSIGATETGAEGVIIHEKTGLLFEKNNAQDLAKQIERLIDNPEWARQLGSNAHEHIMKNFSPEVTFAKYQELYTLL